MLKYKTYAMLLMGLLLLLVVWMISKSINQTFSDYLIYAKYQDKYAVIRATNSIVVGDKNMNLNTYVYHQDDNLVLTTDFGYKYPYQSLDELIGDGISERHVFFTTKVIIRH